MDLFPPMSCACQCELQEVVPLCNQPAKPVNINYRPKRSPQTTREETGPKHAGFHTTLKKSARRSEKHEGNLLPKSHGSAGPAREISRLARGLSQQLDPELQDIGDTQCSILRVLYTCSSNRKVYCKCLAIEGEMRVELSTETGMESKAPQAPPFFLFPPKFSQCLTVVPQPLHVILGGGFMMRRVAPNDWRRFPHCVPPP